MLAVLPWLGVPVLAGATLADLGQPLPGEVLPVVAFLPLVPLAYATALRLPAARRAAGAGLSGAAALLGLLAFIARAPGPGSLATFGVALGATAACVLLLWWAGRRVQSLAPLAGLAGVAMAASQGLDGWQTYFAVHDPFGWLAQPTTERVALSRFLLEAAPTLYPFLKLALAAAVTLGLFRRPQPPTTFVLMTLVVCYAGLSPAMYSAANLLGD